MCAVGSYNVWCISLASYIPISHCVCARCSVPYRFHQVGACQHWPIAFFYTSGWFSSSLSFFFSFSLLNDLIYLFIFRFFFFFFWNDDNYLFLRIGAMERVKEMWIYIHTAHSLVPPADVSFSRGCGVDMLYDRLDLHNSLASGQYNGYDRSYLTCLTTRTWTSFPTRKSPKNKMKENTRYKFGFSHTHGHVEIERWKRKKKDRRMSESVLFSI